MRDDVVEVSPGHEKHEGAAHGGQGVPVDAVGSSVGGGAACDDGEGRGVVAVGQWDSGVGGSGDGGGHARYYLEFHTCVIERLSLFATSAEHERIAAFEPDDFLALSRAVYQEDVDFILGARARYLADVDKLSITACVCEQASIYEAVVCNDIGGLDEAQSLDGEKSRVPGPGSD